MKLEEVETAPYVGSPGRFRSSFFSVADINCNSRGFKFPADSLTLGS